MSFGEYLNLLDWTAESETPAEEVRIAGRFHMDAYRSRTCCLRLVYDMGGRRVKQVRSAVAIVQIAMRELLHKRLLMHNDFQFARFYASAKCMRRHLRDSSLWQKQRRGDDFSARGRRTSGPREDGHNVLSTGE